MLLYLDNCCFNRPFDDQQQLRISLETQAKLFIQQDILVGRFYFVWSYILEYENNRNPFDLRRDSTIGWKDVAVKTIIETEEILSFGEMLMKRDFKLYDALHLACAYIGGCDFFITVDRGILNKQINEIQVCNPIDFVRQLEV
jgi:hypothetical protein